MEVKIHVKGITGSQITKPGEQPGAMFGGLLEIDGLIIDPVVDMRAEFGESFTTLHITLVPGSLTVVNHTEDTWPKFTSRLRAQEERRTIRNADGKTIAIYVSEDTGNNE